MLVHHNLTTLKLGLASSTNPLLTRERSREASKKRRIQNGLPLTVRDSSHLVVQLNRDKGGHSAAPLTHNKRLRAYKGLLLRAKSRKESLLVNLSLWGKGLTNESA